MTALNQDSEDLPGIGEISHRGPAGRRRPVIRATHADAAGADGLDSRGRCAGGSQSRDGEPEFAPVRDARGGRAGGILVTGQQPVLSVSLLITSISAARGRLPVGRLGERIRQRPGRHGHLRDRYRGNGDRPADGPGGLRSTHYKWVALSNTTLGILSATVNGSIVIISLPAIFRGIQLNPLTPGNISYLLWMLMGYLLVSAVLVVTLGRLGDMYGRVRMYNLGFAIFGLAALALPFDPFTGPSGACG